MNEFCRIRDIARLYLELLWERDADERENIKRTIQELRSNEPIQLR